MGQVCKKEKKYWNSVEYKCLTKDEIDIKIPICKAEHGKWNYYGHHCRPNKCIASGGKFDPVAKTCTDKNGKVTSTSWKKGKTTVHKKRESKEGFKKEEEKKEDGGNGNGDNTNKTKSECDTAKGTWNATAKTCIGGNSTKINETVTEKPEDKKCPDCKPVEPATTAQT